MQTVEFQVKDPATGARTPLPDVATWSISPISDGTGVVQLTYPTAGRNFEALRSFVDDDRDALVIVRIDGADAPDYTCIMTEAQGDSADPAAVWTFSGRFQAVYLDQAVIYPDPDAGTVTSNGGLADAQREFSSMNGYQVIAPLMAEAQARGAATEVTYGSFSATEDSAGQPWAKVITTTCSPGVSLLTLLNSLETAGLFQWTMVGADLRLYNPGTLGRDLTAVNPPVILHGPRDLTQAQRTFSSKASVTHLLVAGQQGLYTEADDPSAELRRGRRIEGYYSSGNTQDPGTLDSIAQSQLALLSPGTLQVTHGLAMAATGGPQPLDDFDVYDWIWSDTGNGLERLQVKQWSASMDANGVLTGTVTLNTLIASRAAKLQQQISAISGGQTVVGTSTPPPQVNNQIAPAVPVGLTASSTAYIDGTGATAAQVSGAWTAVTEDANGQPLTDLAGYQVQWRYSAGQGLSTQWNQLAGLFPSPAASWSPVVPNTEVGWQVQAVNSSQLGSGWSAEDTLTTGADSTPPPVPSAPSVVPYLGQLKVSWNGLGSLGEAMPPDFARCEVHVSTTSGFTPSAATLTDQLTGAGTSVASGLTYGTTYYARLVTVDRTGNKSAPGAQSSGIPTTVGLADIAFSDVGNLVDDGGFEDASWRATRFATQPSAGVWTFQSGSAFQGLWSAHGDESVAPGTKRDLFLSSLSTVGADDQFAMRMVVRPPIGNVPNGTLRMAARFYNASGAFISEQAIAVNQSGMVSGAWVEETGAADSSLVSGASFVRFVLSLDTDGTMGAWDVDTCEARKMVGTELIENLAVTDAKIDSLSVGKLTAGTMTAQVALAGRIVAGTSMTGARVELNDTGFYLFDSDGTTQLVTIEEGNVSITGTLTTRTSASGSSRIEIGLDPGGDSLRVYDDANNQVVTIGQIYSAGTPVSNGIQVNDTDGDLIFRLYGSGDNTAQFFYVGKGLGTPFPYIQAHFDGVTASMDYTLTNDDGNLPGSHVEHITGFTFFGTGEFDLRATTLNIMGSANPVSTTTPAYQLGRGPVTLNVYANGINNPVSLAVSASSFQYTSAMSGGVEAAINASASRMYYGLFDGTSNKEGINIFSGSIVGIQGSQIQFHEADGTTWADTFAAAFTVESDSRAKRDITELPEGSMLDVLRNAPVRQWAYNTDKPGARKRIGLLADDLPEELLGPSPEGTDTKTISLATMLAVLHQAIIELDAQINPGDPDAQPGPAAGPAVPTGGQPGNSPVPAAPSGVSRPRGPVRRTRGRAG